MNFEPYKASLNAYANWLDSKSTDSLQMWSAKLKSSDPGQVEGAVGEAVSWDYLAARVDDVDLADKPGTGGPDFLFGQGDQRFYVEVTNISIEAATTETNLSPLPLEAVNYRNLTGRLKSEMISKCGQCAGLDAPVLIFVTTLHFQASALAVTKHHIEMLLHSPPAITMNYDREKGEATGEPYQTTDMRLSAFTKEFTTSPERKHISGVLVGGFGLVPPAAYVLGILHPDPVRPFDPTWLSCIPFCRFMKWPPNRTIEIEWVNES